VKPVKRFSAAARAKYFLHQGANWAKEYRNELSEVEHIHAGWASYPAWIAQGASGVLGVPWSFSAHARDLWVDGEKLGEKLTSAKFASACTSDGTEYLQSFAPDLAERVLYAPHGVELGRYLYRERITPQKPVRILAVGRLVIKKGFSQLIGAVLSLLVHGYSLELTIIGDGVLRGELEKQLAKVNDPNLKLAGARSHEDVIKAMNEANLFVTSSFHAPYSDRDGLPNVLLEAAACGLPIVSTTAGSITDFLDDECAWLCEPGNHTALADAIEAAINNYDESLRRAKNARARVEAQFDIERNIQVLARAFTG
jgi:glycosyltransferase involved in cell wall biosynthesis